MEVKVQEIEVELIIPTSDNTRIFKASSKADAEFAKSVKECGGIHSPPTARPHPDKPNHFDLRFGARRLRATKAAGFKTMPLIIRGLTDKEAREMTVTENMQRENLHPLEEANAIASLLNDNWDRKTLATHFGKTVAWVVCRANLANLSQKWRAAIADPKTGLSSWSAAHLELLAKFPAKTQDLLLLEYSDSAKGKRKWDIKENPACGVKLADLQKMAAGITNTISLALWKDEPGSKLISKRPRCAECQDRSDNDPDMFADLDFGGCAKDKDHAARCLDTSCWDRKLRAWIAVRLKDLGEKHGGLTLLSDATVDSESPWDGQTEYKSLYRKSKMAALSLIHI